MQKNNKNPCQYCWERLIRTIKNGVADRIRFKKGNWTDLYKPTLKKYNNTIYSSTGAKPVEAHKDENRVNVKVNLTLKQKHFRKYPLFAAWTIDGWWLKHFSEIRRLKMA